MSWKQLCIAALAVVALVSSPATAPDEKNQLAGILGRRFISNEGMKGATFSNPFAGFGNGLTFEVNYSLDIEAPLWNPRDVRILSSCNGPISLRFSTVFVLFTMLARVPAQ
jgi:hypothetical protein